MEKAKPKIIITGGGTGGHVYPAIAIADTIRKKRPDAEILFVGAKGKLESVKVPQAGYNIITLPVKGLPRRLSIKALVSFLDFIISIYKAKKIIKSFKPNIVIGVGGYASAPILYAVRKKNICIFLQEQNSFPGLTNRYFAKYANKIFVAYEGLEKWFPTEKIIYSGNPVRNFYENMPSKKKALEYFNFKDNIPTIFLTGGSLGSETLNLSVLKNIDLILNNNIQFIWQTGKIYYNRIMSQLKDKHLPNIVIKPFIDNMIYAYTAADLVIARAGAITVSELAILHKPVIFVPSPNVAEDHQRKNALALVQKNAALIIDDNQAPQKLIKTAIEIVHNPEKLRKLSENIALFAKPQAADTIVDFILSCLEH